VLSPPQNEAHLWLARPGAFGAAALDELDAGERERHARFAFERDREMFRTAHCLTRRALSRYLAVPPRDWRFEAGEHGRPEIAAPARRALRFNLSHTRGLVACVVTGEQDCGVDVEEATRPIDAGALARRFFAPAEAAALQAAPAAEVPRRFFRFWTLKEAYLKARGTGLALPLDGFWFDPDEPRISFGPDFVDTPAGWGFSVHAPTPHHLVAVAIRWGARGPGRVRLFWLP
jgi:4'-phosphopantetheinyl transferase